MKKILLRAHGETNAGSIGKHNDDAFCYKMATSPNSSIGIFAVADGVGGLPQGSTASNIAISCINRWWDQALKEGQLEIESLKKTLLDAILHANNQILLESKQQNIQMGTTLSALLCVNREYAIFNTGDSRVYMGEKALVWRFSQMTEDQVIMVAKEYAGEIIMKPVLEYCLGVNEKTKIFEATGILKKNQTFMLCSDGVYKTVSFEKISNIIYSNRVEAKEACGALIDKALQNKEKDNITAVVVNVLE